MPTALITGASSGFGADFARQLAARGYDLIITARREERLMALRDAIAANHPVTVHVIPLDLGTPGGAQRLFDQVQAAVQAADATVDVLINNAGFGLRGPFLDAPLDRLREMVDLNVRAVTELAWLCARPMVERRHGYILLVASIAAAQPSPHYAAYAATKVYVDYLGQALHHELRDTGVSVTVTSPGPSPTEFGQVARQGASIMHTLGEMPSDAVVRQSLDALFARKRTIVPGWSNAALTTLSSLMPRRITMSFADRFTRSNR